MSENKNEPAMEDLQAFPAVYSNGEADFYVHGMTINQYAAIKICAGMCSNPVLVELDADKIVQLTYVQVRALLKALEAK